jgi:hypothetical protein
VHEITHRKTTFFPIFKGETDTLEPKKSKLIPEKLLEAGKVSDEYALES